MKKKKETRGRKKLPTEKRRMSIYARILPSEYEMLQRAAAFDRRPVAQFLALLIEKFCKENRIPREGDYDGH
jgi:hypothetical protein